MDIQELFQKKGDLVAEQRKLNDDTPPQEWGADQQARWDAIDAELKEVAGKIDAHQKSEEARAQRVAALAAAERSVKANNGDRRIGLDEARREEANPERIVANAVEDRHLAIQAWLLASNRRTSRITDEHRSACQRLNVEIGSPEFEMELTTRYSDPAWSSQGRQELRAGLDVTTSGKGMETIPEGFLYELERKMLAFGGPRSVCRILRTASGNALPMPTVDDTSNSGELLAEATTIGTSVDPTFAAVTLNAYKYSSKAILVSAELLEDSAFNLGAEIGSLLGERLGRIMATHDTTGTGSSQPNGIVTASTAGVTAVGTTSFTADEVISLQHKIDPAYRANPSVGWMMNDLVLAFIRKLKDANGMYLWQPGLQAGVPDRLLGSPIAINQAMSGAMTTGTKPLIYADFSKFVIRDVAQLRFYRLEERYRDTDQTGFVCFMRHDADTIQATAIQRLTLA